MLQVFDQLGESVQHTLSLLLDDDGDFVDGPAVTIIEMLRNQAPDAGALYVRWCKARARETACDEQAESQGGEQAVEESRDAHDQRMQKGLMEALPIYQAMRVAEIVSAARALDSDRVREKMGALLAVYGAAPPKSGDRAAELQEVPA